MAEEFNEVHPWIREVNSLDRQCQLHEHHAIREPHELNLGCVDALISSFAANVNEKWHVAQPTRELSENHNTRLREWVSSGMRGIEDSVQINLPILVTDVIVTQVERS